MSAEDLERYETEIELGLYREYRDVVGLFSHVVETERRFYLTNHVDVQVRSTAGGEAYFAVRSRSPTSRCPTPPPEPVHRRPLLRVVPSSTAYDGTCVVTSGDGRP